MEFRPSSNVSARKLIGRYTVNKGHSVCIFITNVNIMFSFLNHETMVKVSYRGQRKLNSIKKQDDLQKILNTTKKFITYHVFFLKGKPHYTIFPQKNKSYSKKFVNDVHLLNRQSFIVIRQKFSFGRATSLTFS